MILIGGGTPKTTKDEYWNGNIPWLSVKDFNNDFRYVYETEKSITELGLEKSSTKMLQKGDVIISARGTVGEIAIIPFPMAFNQSCYGLRAKEDMVTSDFLYYLVKYNINVLKKNTHGSVFDTITRDTFDSIEVEIPDLITQQKIASILGDFDNKIEFNNAINNNLADLLQTAYQEQFGDLRSTTRHGTLSDICSYSTDRVAVSDLNVSTYFSTENMLQGKAGAIEATSLPTTRQTTSCQKGDTLISNIRPYFKKIVYCEAECGCSTDVLCFTPVQSQYAAYLFSTLYADKFFAFMVAGSKGTKMPRGDKQQIMKYPVAIPSSEELESFNALALPILAQIHSNIDENKRLSAIRDELLPKLMSGELDVSNIDL
jgi:type I restriction enzyme S subunit